MTSLLSSNSPSYHLTTLFLFTSDQVLDTVIPGTIFGLSAALSGPILSLPPQSFVDIAPRLPATWIWLWLVILQFCLQNQRSTNSIAEDKINKPWRPIASGRISQSATWVLLLCVYALNTLLSMHLHVVGIYAAWTFLGTLYNDFKGGDFSGLSRNVFCGALFCCTFSGALSIALGREIQMSTDAWWWTLAVTFGVIATTIHVQDFRDEVGDRARERKTLVLTMGRGLAAWSVVLAVLGWAVYVPVLLGSLAVGWVLEMGVALGLAGMAVWGSGGFDAKRDRNTYKVWCLWIAVCCGMPVLAGVNV